MYKIVFSATGRTMKVADAFCSEWGKTNLIDISNGDFTAVNLTADDLCLVAVPVYGGCVPSPAVENICRINANGAKAVIMAVYGNRAYDGALAQLKSICIKSGFTVVAAVSAVAQHSLMPQVAASRPDVQDVAQLSGWGVTVLEKHKSKTLPADVTVPGTPPEKFHSLPVHPKAGKGCTSCGLCRVKCPVKAIPQDNPSHTDSSRCITCMRCTHICPSHSRTLLPVVMKIAGPVMSKVWAEYTANEFFIN